MAHLLSPHSHTTHHFVWWRVERSQFGLVKCWLRPIVLMHMAFDVMSAFYFAIRIPHYSIPSISIWWCENCITMPNIQFNTILYRSSILLPPRRRVHHHLLCGGLWAAKRLKRHECATTKEKHCRCKYFIKLLVVFESLFLFDDKHLVTHRLYVQCPTNEHHARALLLFISHQNQLFVFIKIRRRRCQALNDLVQSKRSMRLNFWSYVKMYCFSLGKHQVNKPKIDKSKLCFDAQIQISDSRFVCLITPF